MKKLLLCACMACVPSWALGGVLFDAPEGWLELQIPDPHNPSVRAVEGYATADANAFVVLMNFVPIHTQEDLELMVEGNLKESQKAGHGAVAVDNVTVAGCTAKRMKGVIQHPERGPMNQVGHFIASDQATLYVSYLFVDGAGSAKDVDELLKHVRVPGKPVVLTARMEDDGVARRVGKLAGGFTLLAFVFGALMIVIQRSKSQPKPPALPPSA